jgi:hypothetical protein
MATNTTVLIVAAAVAALLLAGMLAGVVYKTRTRQRPVKGETIRDQAEENARQVRYQESLADGWLSPAPEGWSSSQRVVRSRTRPPDSMVPSKHLGPNPTEQHS